MKKILGAIALLLLLAAGVWVNSRLPAPHVKAREAVGELGTNPNDYVINTYSSGDGPPVIMVPSLGRDASDFNELSYFLRDEGFRSISMDFQSPVGIDFFGPNLSEFSRPLDPYLKPENDAPSAILIGHAFGNRVARMAAYQNPDNVKGVILLAAGGQVPMEPEAQQAARNIFNPLRSYKSRMKDVEYAFFADGNEIPDYWKRGWHTKTAMAQAKAVTASIGDDSWHCAGGVPMLIVQPMQDRIAPIENAYTLRDKCPQEVEIVEVQNAGHALLPEQPEAVAKAVLDFLAKHHPIPPE